MASMMASVGERRGTHLRYFRTLKADQVFIDLVRTLVPEKVGGAYWSMDMPRRDAVAL
jgi:mannosyltransferase OCH1-like enzyme